MFHNHPSFEKLGNDIYVFHNFLSNKELNHLQKFIKANERLLWNYKGEDIAYHKFSAYTVEVDFIYNKLMAWLSIYSPENYVKKNNSIIKLRKGETWSLHADNHDYLELRKKASKYKEGSEFTLEDNNIWGLIVYLNDFEGGEVFYPRQNLTIKPLPGDLILHSSDEHCEHEVLEVLSEARFCYSNAIFEKIKVPIS